MELGSQNLPAPGIFLPVFGRSESSKAVTPSPRHLISSMDWSVSSLLLFSLSSSHSYKVRKRFRLLWSTGSTSLEAMLRTVTFLPVIKPLRYCLNLLNWFREKTWWKKPANPPTTLGKPIIGNIIENKASTPINCARKS